jgi:protein phosphatase 2C family protein 2/3
VLDPSKISTKENGNIKAYAVNSNQGISRKYNEDRVSIILNIMKNGVKASFFAIYDGHGGSNCCDFLTQNLHQFVFNSKHFPSQPRQALI